MEALGKCSHAVIETMFLNSADDAGFSQVITKKIKQLDGTDEDAIRIGKYTSYEELRLEASKKPRKEFVKLIEQMEKDFARGE